MNEAGIIAGTRCWIERVVIGHDFCPFAKRPYDNGRVRITVSGGAEPEAALIDLIAECKRLDHESAIETNLVVYPAGFAAFEDFLDLIDLGERLLAMQGYEGIYQLAHFHPDYRFDGSDAADPANYTNRSPWPMLHLIRAASLERALEHHPDPQSIPRRNIEHARRVGEKPFVAFLSACRQQKAP